MTRQEATAGQVNGEVQDLRSRVFAAAEELGVLRRRLTEWADGTPLQPEQIDSVRLATYEAAANVVEHAYRSNRGQLELEAVCRRQTVTVTVTDHGRWLPKTVDPDSTRGHGLPLIRALTDSVHITTSPNGTSVRMTWTLN